jgi:hypothetical protein
MQRSLPFTFSFVALNLLGLLACSSDDSGNPIASAGTGAAGAAGAGSVAGASGTGGAGGLQGQGQGGNGEAPGTLPLAGASGSGGTGAVSPDAGAPALRTPFQMTGIIGTGQSLAVGAQAGGSFGSSPSDNNLKLALGGATVPPFDSSAASLSLVPLSEPIRPLAAGYPSDYPANIYGESHHTAMGAQITALAKAAGAADYVTVHTVVGESGQGMNVINKAATENINGAGTGRAYAASIFEVQAIKRLAEAQGKTYGVGAIFLTHGETDSASSTYEADMVKLAADYNADVSAITGQTEKIPMFTSQQHAYGFSAGVRSAASPGMLQQWRVGVDNPGDVIVTGPKYQYPYFTDNVHLVNRGYELMGEKYAEVYFKVAVLGQEWQPLQPTTVERNGAVLTVHFQVPVAPLVWDTTLEQPHQTALTAWAQGKGFEVRSGGTDLTIQSVEIVGADTVQITTTTDVPAGATLGYAATSDGVALPGRSVRWGLLKDSDPFVGAVTGEAQANFAVSFEMTVP